MTKLGFKWATNDFLGFNLHLGEYWPSLLEDEQIDTYPQ